jgi:hypothetical protein
VACASHLCIRQHGADARPSAGHAKRRSGVAHAPTIARPPPFPSPPPFPPQEYARGALHGSALAQLAPGYLDAVLLSAPGPSATGPPAEAAAALAGLLAARLPATPLLRLPPAASSAAPQPAAFASLRAGLLRGAEQLLPPPAERLARRRAAAAERLWAGSLAVAGSRVGGGKGGGGLCGGGGCLLAPLAAVALHFEGELDEARLRWASRVLSGSQDTRGVMRVWFFAALALLLA